MKHNSGFTVMELMIATAVFSVLLLISLVGFLQIGQLFYKGVNITRTSDVSKQVISSVKNDISFYPGTAAITIQGPSQVSPSGGPTINRYWFCAGQNRYSFILYRPLDSAAQATEMTLDVSGWYRFALLKDRITVTPPACPNPFNTSGSAPINPGSVTELLGDKMRLARFTLTPIGTSLYTLNVRIAYGIDEVLNNPTNENVSCKSGSNNSRYCFVTQVRTTARRGITP
jgi:prepilin-type N-terminal cleavage/methylation domain-containing protein